MSFPTTIVIANAKPSIVIQSLEGISIDSQGLLRVESQPSVISVNYLAVNGRDGADGEMPDFGDPGVIADMLAALSAQITGSQLHSDLLRSIEKIDVGPTSLEAQASLLAYADSLLSASIAEDSARIDANEAAVVILDGRLDTFGVDLATLDGAVTANSAAIDSIETRVVAAESDIYTQAQTIQGISSRIDVAESNLTAQAAIVNQNTTAITEIDGDITSVAETLSTITAGVGGMDAAIQIRNQVIAGTTTPLYAQHTVKIDVNGKISGFGLSSTNDSSLFEILADRFAVYDGVNPVVPFIIDGGKVYIDVALIRDLTSTNILAGSITADSIDADSIRTAILSADSITADMYHELRQTFSFTGGDSLDEVYPFDLPFRVPSETTQIVSVRVSLKITPWRSYAKNIPSGGGSTSSTNSSIATSSSDGGSGYYATTGSATAYTATGNVKESNVGVVSITATDFTSTESSPTHNHDLSYGKTLAYLPSHTHYLDSSAFSGHTHNLSIPNHTHSVTIAGHSHPLPDHNHTLTQGIYQDATGAVVSLSVDGGIGYQTPFGSFTTEATDVDITSQVYGSGWKSLRISATSRCRVFAIIECKVDISA